MQEPRGFEESSEHYLAARLQYNERYLADRLQYQETKPDSWRAFSNVSGSDMASALKGAWFRGFLLATIVSPVAFLFIFVGDDAGVVVALFLWLAAWIVPLFIRDHVYAGHWELSLEDQGHLVEPAFALTAQRLQAKQTSATIEPRRVRSSVTGVKLYYLTTRQERYTAYISVLSYGMDLFVSWSMWREQRPLPILWSWLVDTLRSLIGRSTNFHQFVRSDPARAMREAVHNSARAGVEAAIEGQQATIVGTFGHEIPEERDRLAGGSTQPLGL